MNARLFRDPDALAASAAPAALVAPRLDAGLGPVAALFAQAVHRALDLYTDTSGALLARGALQLAVGEKDPSRFARIASSDLFEPGAVSLSAGEGESGPVRLRLEIAGVLDPETVVQAWAPDVTEGRVESLQRFDRGWRLHGPPGELLAEAEIVVIANGPATPKLAPGLPVRSVRGQASLARSHPPDTADPVRRIRDPHPDRPDVRRHPRPRRLRARGTA